MTKIMLTIDIKYRYWFWSMVGVGQFAVRLGACPEKIAAWIVKYGMKLEIK